jgi:peptide/nickel transport system permease protein
MSASGSIEAALATSLDGNEIDIAPMPPPGRTFGDKVAPLVANKLALLGGVLTIAFLVIGVVGIAIVANDDWQHLYLDQNVRNTLILPFNEGSFLGTDNLGRSMAWRLVAGAGISLAAGLAVTVLSMSIGMALGSLAGYAGGTTDRIISAFIDLTWGFPVILVAVIFVGMLAPGLTAVILAISVVNWAGYARIVRAQTMSLKGRAFVEAARALGVPRWKIVVRHLIPNMLGTTLVMASYYIAVTVIAEAGLSFIGLGAQPPTPSLGQMVSNGRSFLSRDVWVVVLPGGMVALLVLALNTLGDGLRDIFDPRLRRW